MLKIFITLITLGIVQGIAEFLPISSSGHLVLFEQLPFFKEALHSIGSNLELFINVSLHFATLIAVIIYLWNDVTMLVTGFFTGLLKRDFKNPDFQAAINIVAASIPAALVGILLNDYIEVLFSSFVAVSIMLIVNGFILLSTKYISPGSRSLKEVGILRSFKVGLFQALAIIPGISRSGMTISGGMLFGMKPEDAARFSFLMSLPVIGGAGLIEGLKASERGLDASFYVPLAVAMLVCILVALASMKILFALVKRVKIDIFGYYTIAAGAVGIAIHLLI